MSGQTNIRLGGEKGKRQNGKETKTNKRTITTSILSNKRSLEKQLKHRRKANTYPDLQSMLIELKKNPIVNRFNNRRRVIKPRNKRKYRNTTLQSGRDLSGFTNLTAMLDDLARESITTYASRQRTNPNNKRKKKERMQSKTGEHEGSQLPDTTQSKKIKITKEISYELTHTTIKNRLDKMAEKIRKRQTTIQEQQQKEQEKKRQLKINRIQREKNNQQVREDNKKKRARAQEYKAERQSLQEWLEHSAEKRVVGAEIQKKNKKRKKKQITLDK